mmetsp:Transcript_13854/g.21711  ORF Transcript_13854/g.21711 Transcript_13854/m.21711 type:complete len:272 (+) Transcript_13854:753-1568(+)
MVLKFLKSIQCPCVSLLNNLSPQLPFTLVPCHCLDVCFPQLTHLVFGGDAQQLLRAVPVGPQEHVRERQRALDDGHVALRCVGVVDHVEQVRPGQALVDLLEHPEVGHGAARVPHHLPAVGLGQLRVVLDLLHLDGPVLAEHHLGLELLRPPRLLHLGQQLFQHGLLGPDVQAGRPRLPHGLLAPAHLALRLRQLPLLVHVPRGLEGDVVVGRLQSPDVGGRQLRRDNVVQRVLAEVDQRAHALALLHELDVLPADARVVQHGLHVLPQGA